MAPNYTWHDDTHRSKPGWSAFSLRRLQGPKETCVLGLVETDHDRSFIATDAITEKEAHFPTLELAFDHVEKSLTRELALFPSNEGTVATFLRPNGDVVKWEIQGKLNRS